MICLLTVIPVRSKPNDRAEIVTQMLFGETCTVIEKDEKSSFVKIKQDFDGYEGWVDNKQITSHSATEKEEYSLSIVNSIRSGNTFILPLGAVVTASVLEDKGVEFTGKSGLLPKEELIPLAMKYLNTPYLWGGKSQFGIDCSGFVQQVFKICGINLPRDAYQQEEIGQVIPFSELQVGDLAYFGKDRVTHVGIILENKQIIHAHGFVRISPFDEKGILKDDLKKYSHSALSYRRVQ